MAEVTMPRLSDTMSEGSVGRWLKKPGDKVENDDILAEIETDKATMELQAFEGGYLQKILVPEGQTVPIGTPIAIIGAEAQAAEATPAETATPASDAQQAPTEEGSPEANAKNTAESQAQAGQAPAATAQPQPTEQTNGQDGEERVKASPLARRLAAEHGVDLRQVQGTGPGGRIIKENVEGFLEGGGQAAATPAPATATPTQAPSAPAPTAPAAKPAAPPPASAAPAGEVVPMSRMRRAIARAMTDSQPGTPHIYVTVEIDMAAVMQLRRSINDSGAAPVKISVNDLVVKAAAKALLKIGGLNRSYATGADGQPGIVQHQQVNVSVAVALEDGLVAPVVRDADKKSVGTIAAEIKDMAGRARENKLKQNELEGATFQVSNLGMFEDRKSVV